MEVDKHPQIPGMGMGAAGSVLMANQATLRPSPILPTLLEVALSSFLSFSRVPEGLGMDFCRISGWDGSLLAQRAECLQALWLRGLELSPVKLNHRITE